MDLQLMSSSLSTHERSVIETMIKLNHSISEITCFIKWPLATITYELNRIKPYNAQQTHHLSQCHLRKRSGHQKRLLMCWALLSRPLITVFTMVFLKLSYQIYLIKGISCKRQFDGRRLVFAHGHSISKRPWSF